MIFSFGALCIFLTDIGDSAVIAAVVLVSSFYLLAARCRESAIAVCASLALSVVGIGLVKILFLGCGNAFHAYHIASPSGHSALSVAVYGTLAVIIGGQLTALWRIILAALTWVLITLIALTRVLLSFHTVQEVILGMGIGGAALLIVVKLLQKTPKAETFNPVKLLAGIVIAGGFLHGIRMPAEEVIRAIALYFRRYSGCEH